MFHPLRDPQLQFKSYSNRILKNVQNNILKNVQNNASSNINPICTSLLLEYGSALNLVLLLIVVVVALPKHNQYNYKN